MNEILQLKTFLTGPVVIFLLYLILRLTKHNTYSLISDLVDYILGTKKENDKIRAMKLVIKRRHDKAVTRLEEVNTLVEQQIKKDRGER